MRSLEYHIPEPEELSLAGRFVDRVATSWWLVITLVLLVLVVFSSIAVAICSLFRD